MYLLTRIAPFFGDLVNVPSQGAGRDLLRRNDDLPAFYADGRRNEFLTDVLEGLTALDNGWPTTVCLPLTYTEKINFQWNLFEFTQPLADQVPHEGVSRILEHGKSTRTERSIRRGLAIFFEHDFMTTSDGVRDYARSLQQIRMCVHRTNSFDVISAIMNCHQVRRIACSSFR